MLLPQMATSQSLGDRPQIKYHYLHDDILSGKYSLQQTAQYGEFLFSTPFGKIDGFGRPAATGSEIPTKRAIKPENFLNRISGPEAASCAGCHNQPGIGGAGDFVANVFFHAQDSDPVITNTDAEFSSERNTLGMFGSGVIEALAVEMSQELIAIRESAVAEAKSKNKSVTKALITKDVDFGKITANADGSLDTSKIEGVDSDLIIKPFHQKGVVNSIRTFTINACNQHHGLQADERFGAALTGSDDFDGDGVKNEMSVGDITALVIFQATLPVPRRVLPSDPAGRREVTLGEDLFKKIGCGSCHRPEMVLNKPIFQEPNPFNGPGNLRVQDVKRPMLIDLTKDGPGHRLPKTPDGKGIVRAFTDLKRHKIADESDMFFANEKKRQNGIPVDTFMTRKLWDVGNSAPYGHRGDCMTIGEAIFHHAGEAKESRNKFMNLKDSEKEAIITFLRTLVAKPSSDGWAIE